MKDEKDNYESVINGYYNRSMYEKESYNGVSYKQMLNSFYGKYEKTPEKTDEEKLKEERIRKLNEIL